jgi:hypothetical protein
MKILITCIALAISLSGCNKTTVHATYRHEVGPLDPTEVTTKYCPSSTLLKPGEITPDEAIAIAKKVAEKYFGDLTDIETAKVLFSTQTLWIIDFYVPSEAQQGMYPHNRLISINKRTGDAIIETVY